MVRARGVARKSFARRRVRRVKKYDCHVTPLRFKKYLPNMVELLKPPLDIHVECEIPCMELLETLGVPLSEYPYYLGFMKRMIVLYQAFTSETLQKEKDSLISEYVLRGKDEDVLEQVQEVAALCAEAIFEMDLWTRDFYWQTLFESIDGYELVLGGAAASVTLNTDGYVLITTDPAIGTGAGLIKHRIGTLHPPSWDKNVKIRTKVRLLQITNQTAFFGTMDGTLNNGFGLYVGDNLLQGMVILNGVPTTVNLQNVLANIDYLLEAVLTPNVGVKFYVDGVEMGSLTVFPTGDRDESDAHIIEIGISNTDGVAKSVRVYSWEFYQKR